LSTELYETVCEVIADVLVISPELIEPDTALVADLGAESIDFIDLLFRLAEVLKVRMPVETWDAYVQARMAVHQYATGITTNFIVGFAEEVAGRAS
jgi:acyl carrier protein